MAKRRRDRRPRAPGRAPRHVAHRPGTAPPPERKRERTLPPWVLPVAAIVGAVVIVAGIGAYIGYRQATGGSSESSASATTPTATTPTATAPAKPQTAAALFAHNCSVCHNLRAAGSSTGIGPDLDQIRPTRAQVLQQIRTGSLDGIMQPNLVTGADAERVAAYVAAVAGRTGKG